MLLIAEDDPDDQFLIQRAAKEVCPPETQLYFVDDGILLLDYLHHEMTSSVKPKLIMLDLNMPRKDGREAIREIKNDPELAQIPLVILTTSSIEDDYQYCQGFGISGYYQKPGTMSELRAIMDKICEDYIG